MVRFPLVAVLASVALLGGCSSAEILSSGQGKVTIAVEDASDLSDASEAAADVCGEGRADLIRTETVPDGIIAYYECR